VPLDAKPPAAGHNQGPPLDPGQSWRRYCWQKAYEELWAAPPIEVVQRRMARAAWLGLSYQQYARILVSGGEVDAFLFTVDAVVGGGGAAIRKLATISGCQRLLLGSTDRLADRIDSGDLALFSAKATVASRHMLAAAPSKADRNTLARLFRDQRVRRGTVVLIGEGVAAPAWVAGGRLAGFIPARDYFSQ
jgi:hypothetical protein